MTRHLIENTTYLSLDSAIWRDRLTALPGAKPDTTAEMKHSASMVSDHSFGAALMFSNGAHNTAQPDHLSIEGLSFRTCFCASFWINPSDGGAEEQVLFAFSGGWYDISFRLKDDGKTLTTHYLDFEVNIPRNSWSHVIISRDTENEMSVVVNGVLIERKFFHWRDEGTFGSSIHFGANPAKTEEAGFTGRMAHLRLSEQPETQDLWELYALDRLPSETFREISPLEMTLLDEKQTSNLFIEGGEIAHRLTLSVWNRDPDGAAVEFMALGHATKNTLVGLQNASLFAGLIGLSKDARVKAARAGNDHKDDTSRADDIDYRLGEHANGSQADFQATLVSYFRQTHHMEMRFPPGTISSKTRARMHDDLISTLARRFDPAQEHWFICYQKDPIDQTDRVYFLAAFNLPILQAQDAGSLAPALRIIFPHIAVQQEVEEQVIPVELRPGPLARRVTDFSRLGPTIQLMEVKSQIGQRLMPLHFGVAGSDQVLNDGVAETFVLLQITNIDRAASIRIDRTGNLQTRFTLSCELSEFGRMHDWGLSDQQANIQLWLRKAMKGDEFPPDPDRETDWPHDPLIARSDGNTLSWQFDGTALATDELAPNDTIYLRLGIRTNQRTGGSKLQLKYRHVPGYWDGERACFLQKSPLVLDWDAGSLESRVGIGTERPASKLSVTDGVSVGSGFADIKQSKAAPKDGLIVEGNVGIGTNDPLHKFHVTGGDMRLEGGTLHVNQIGGDGVLELGNGELHSTLKTELHSGALVMNTAWTDRHIVLQPQGGNVGIGVSSPGHSLEVNGRIKGVLDGADLINQSVTLEELTLAVQDALCPVGTILSYAGDYEPSGWVLCNGGNPGYDPNDPIYWPLYDIIGHRFGSWYDKERGYFFFKVPDLRGMFMRGHDAGAGMDPEAPDRYAPAGGTAEGDKVGSLQDDKVGPHSHKYSRTLGIHNIHDSSGSNRFTFHDRDTGDTEMSTDVETRPRNMAVNFIIKL